MIHDVQYYQCQLDDIELLISLLFLCNKIKNHLSKFILLVIAQRVLNDSLMIPFII